MPENDPPERSFRPLAATSAGAPSVESVEATFEKSSARLLSDLGKIGLTRWTGGENRSASEGSFDALPMVGAVTVRLNDEKVAERVIDAAENRYRIVLDVRADSDLAWSANRIRKIRKSAPAIQWPVESGIQEAWSRNIRGRGVLAAVLDTGVDADHAEFKKRPVEFRYLPPSGADSPERVRDVRGFDTDGHGTHVCGIIAGHKLGIARAVDLHVAAVIESETYRTSLWRTIYGLNWLFRRFVEPEYINVPCVVNLSLCFYESQMDPEEIDDWRFLLGRAIKDLKGKGALVVAAAGNQGADEIGWPASFADVLAVGAVDWLGNVAPFSGRPTPNARRDIYGYGVDVNSALERSCEGYSRYMAMNGTSMAAPYVVGIAALLLQTRPGASASDVKDHILSTATDLGGGALLARFQHW